MPLFANEFVRSRSAELQNDVNRCMCNDLNDLTDSIELENSSEDFAVLQFLICLNCKVMLMDLAHEL